MSIEHLDFKVDILDRYGPQEFVDRYSEAASSGMVSETDTFHGGPVPGSVFLGMRLERVGFKGITLSGGLRVIVANEGMDRARVLDVISMPEGSARGVAAEYYVSLAANNQGSVLVQRLELTRGGIITCPVPVRGVVKAVPSYFTRIESAVVERMMAKLDPRQKQEYGLSSKVYAVLGPIVLD